MKTKRKVFSKSDGAVKQALYSNESWTMKVVDP